MRSFIVDPHISCGNLIFSSLMGHFDIETLVPEPLAKAGYDQTKLSYITPSGWDENEISSTMLNYTRKDGTTKQNYLLRVQLPNEPQEKELWPASIALGIPKLPIIPTSGTRINDIVYDPWGRRHCSDTKAVCLLLVCIFAPPLWLLIGAGYLDRMVGVVPRTAKLVSFGLGLAAMLIAFAVAVLLATV